jgi:streptogramin lyase
MMRPAIMATAVALLGSALALPALSADTRAPAPGKPDSALPGKSGSAGKAVANAAGGPYFFYENGQKKALRVDPGWVADFALPAKPEPGKPRTPVKRFIGGEKGLETLPSGSSPVFRDDNGAMRALAGGVVVRLREADVPDARARLADAGLLPVRQLDPEGRSWLVASPAGIPSLELANQLHESGKFESATPNWWRPRSLK